MVAPKASSVGLRLAVALRITRTRWKQQIGENRNPGYVAVPALGVGASYKTAAIFEVLQKSSGLGNFLTCVAVTSLLAIWRGGRQSQVEGQQEARPWAIVRCENATRGSGRCDESAVRAMQSRRYMRRRRAAYANCIPWKARHSFVVRGAAHLP